MGNDRRDWADWVRMAERRELAEMIGEGMREIGVLIAVFGMLDKFVLTEVGPTPVSFLAPWASSLPRASDEPTPTWPDRLVDAIPLPTLGTASAARSPGTSRVSNIWTDQGARSPRRGRADAPVAARGAAARREADAGH